METILDSFTQGLNSETLTRLALAVLLGGLVGIERELRGRAAGLRTLIIVCLGATLIMIISTRLPTQFYTGPGEAIIRVDPGRIAAGIVTGIGFLGAGVVLKLGDIVRGVTTAACIWFVAALGIAIGEGHYGLSVTATLIALAVLWLLHYVEAYIQGNLHRCITVTIDSGLSSDALEKILKLLEKRRISLDDLHTGMDRDSGTTTLRIYIKYRREISSHDVIGEVASVDGVRAVDWS